MDLFQKRQFFQLISNDINDNNNDDDESLNQSTIIELATFSNVHIDDDDDNNENDDDGNKIDSENEFDDGHHSNYHRIHSERNFVLYTSDYRLHLFQYGLFDNFIVEQTNNNNNKSNGDGQKKWQHWIIPIDPDKGSIVSMCFNQNGQQLLAITNKSIIYVIPFNFISYYDPIINHYRTVIENDASLRLNCRKTIQQPTSIVWWQRNKHYVKQRLSIALIGTKSGQISMIDLDLDQEFNRCSISEPIRSLKIYDEMYNRSLLITSEQGQQYQLILEEFRCTNQQQQQSLITTTTKIEPCLTTKTSISTSSPLSKLSELFQSFTSKESKTITTTSQNSGKFSDFNNYYLTCLLNLSIDNDDNAELALLNQINQDNIVQIDDPNDNGNNSLISTTTLRPQLIQFNQDQSSSSSIDFINNKSTTIAGDIFSFTNDDLFVPLMSTTIPTAASHHPHSHSHPHQTQQSNVKWAIYPSQNLMIKNSTNANNNIYVVKYQNCAKLKLQQTNSLSSSSNHSFNSSTTTTTDNVSGNEADSSDDSQTIQQDFLIISKKSSKIYKNNNNNDKHLDNDFCNISLYTDQIIFELYEYSWQKFCTKNFFNLNSSRLFSISLTISDNDSHHHHHDNDSNSNESNLIRLIDCSYRFLLLVFPSRLCLISKTFSEQTNKSGNRMIGGGGGGGNQTVTGSPRSPLLLKRSDSSGHRRSSPRHISTPGTSSSINRFGGSFRRKSPSNHSPGTPSLSTSMSNLSNLSQSNCSIIAEFRFDDQHDSNEIIDVFVTNQYQNGINIRDYLQSKLLSTATTAEKFSYQKFDGDQQQQQFDHQEHYLIDLLSSDELEQGTNQLDEEFIVVTKQSVFIIESKEKSFGHIFHTEILSFLIQDQENGCYQDGDLINRAKFLVDCFSPSSTTSSSSIHSNRSSLYRTSSSYSSTDSPSLSSLSSSSYHPTTISSMIMMPSQSWQLWLCRSALLLMKQIFNDNEQLRCLSDIDRQRIISIVSNIDTIDSNLQKWIQNRLNQIFRLLELCRCPRRRVITALNHFGFWSYSIWQLRKFFHTKILFELNDDERNYLSWQLFESLLAIYQFYHQNQSNNEEKSLSIQNLYDYFYEYRQYYNHQLILYRLIQLDLFEMSEYLAQLHGDYLYLIYFILQYKCAMIVDDQQPHSLDSNRRRRHRHIIRLLTSKHVTYSLILSTEFIHYDHQQRIGKCRSIHLIEQYLQFLFNQLPKLSLRYLLRLAWIFDPKRLSVRLLINQTLFYCNQTYLCNDKHDYNDDDEHQHDRVEDSIEKSNESISDSESSLITSTGKLRKSLLPIKRRDLLNMEIFLQSLCLQKMMITNKSSSSQYDWSFAETVIDWLPKHLEIYQKNLDKHYQKYEQKQKLLSNEIIDLKNYFENHIVAGTHCSLIFDYRQYCLWGRFDYTFMNSERLEQIFSFDDHNQQPPSSSTTAECRIPLQSIQTNRLTKPQCNRYFSSLINDPIRSISIGYQHLMILTDNGIYAIGSSTFGQLGLGSQILHTRYPLLLEFGQNITGDNDSKKIWKIVCGSYHTLLLSIDGHLYSFGWSLHGQLGHGNSIDDQYEPKLIRYFFDTIKVSIADVAAGYAHTAALTTTGDLYLFGQNCYGQLGIEGEGGCSGNKFFLPQRFTLISGPIRMICCGPFHTVCIAIDHDQSSSSSDVVKEKLYCWGIDPKTWRLKMRADRQTLNNQHNRNMNSYGAIGGSGYRDQTVDYTKIREISLKKLPDNCCIQKMSAGQSHTLLLTDQGTIFAFGNGRDGQLGLSKQSSSSTILAAELEAQPISINFIDDNDDDDHDYIDYNQNPNRFIDIACGSFHSLAIDFDGNIWGWGQNSNGQLFEQSSSTTTSTNMGDGDDLSISLSSHNDNDTDSPKSSKHITINLNSSSSSNQMILTSNSPKHNRWQPSILFAIKDIMEQQNFSGTFDFDNFTDWQIPNDNDDDGNDDKSSKDLKKLQRKILLTLLYYRHDLNLKSLIQRFEQLKLYQLCSIVSWLANDRIKSLKYQFDAFQQELLLFKNDNEILRSKFVEEISHLLKFFIEQIDLNYKIQSSSSQSIRCRMTAKLLDNFLQFWNKIQKDFQMIFSMDFIQILEQIFFDKSMINPYFGPLLLILIKQMENDDDDNDVNNETDKQNIRYRLGLTDHLLMKIVERSDELIRQSLEWNHDPIVTLQELFAQSSSDNYHHYHIKWPLEIKWQNIVDEYLRQPATMTAITDQSMIEIEIPSDIEEDPLLLIFKCGHTMTRTKFQSKLESIETPTTFTMINQKLSNEEIDYECLNNLIKDLNCIECYHTK